MTHVKRARLAAAALVAACGIAVSTAAATPASAATLTRPVVTHSPAVPAETVLFTPIAHAGHATPNIANTAFSCGIGYPNVTDTFSNGEISWTASVQCNIVLRMQGTTVLFRWGSSSAYAFGSSYDHNASFSSSSGAVYGIFNGTWGVNNNVLLFIPAGYTTTVGAGCYYVNSSQIHCTETTGPITAQ